jgi:hypothetical protein
MKHRTPRLSAMCSSALSMVLIAWPHSTLEQRATAPRAQTGAVRSLNTTSDPDISGVWMPQGRVAKDLSGLNGPKVASVLQPSDSWRTSYAMPHLTNTLPPLRPEWLAKFKAVNPADNPEAGCMPPDAPAAMLEPYPIEIVQIPGQVILLLEYEHLVRFIHIGRPHPENTDPTFLGDSIGKWQGDTLAVDTVAFKDTTWLDATGLPHTDALHVTERIRRIKHDTLEDRITIDDPKAYTKPWSVRKLYQLKPDWQILEFECEENNRGDTAVQGK